MLRMPWYTQEGVAAIIIMYYLAWLDVLLLQVNHGYYLTDENPNITRKRNERTRGIAS